MCSDSPDLPKEANKAKCIAAACCVVCAPAATKPPPPRAAPHTAATQGHTRRRARPGAGVRACPGATLALAIPMLRSAASRVRRQVLLLPHQLPHSPLGSARWAHGATRMHRLGSPGLLLRPQAPGCWGLQIHGGAYEADWHQTPTHRPKQTHRTPAAPLPTPYLTPITLTLTLT